MRLGVTGGTGLVGRVIVEEALAAGDDVTVMGRTPPARGFFSRPVRFLGFDLSGPAPDLSGQDALVHAALLHAPGRYRGGEGDDPQGFARANLDGTRRLVAAAEAAGLSRLVFLSSRAVYGPQPPGFRLTEAAPCRPNTLYGEVKLAAEAAFAASAIPAVSLRATGVYGPAGPGRRHKWQDLFEDFAAGRAIASRAGTEVHGADLAAAVRMALSALAPGAWNVSDILLDRAELLARWSRLTGITGPLPPPATAATAAGFNEMDTGALRAAGWSPGGMDRLEATLRDWAAVAR